MTSVNTQDSQLSRLGQIIKLIGANPGIKLTALCVQLQRSGISVTERTVAKDIDMLKKQYNLLPDQPRLRQGYDLEGICSLSPEDIELVLDALHVFGLRLSDQQSMNLYRRLSANSQRRDQAGATETRRVRAAGPVRSIRQRNIYARTGKAESIQSTLLQAIHTHRRVQITYFTPRIGRTIEAQEYPILMTFHERGWYCIMRSTKSKTFYPRRCDRVRSCSIMAGAVNHSHSDDYLEAEFLISCGWGMSFPANRLELEQSDRQEPIVVRFERSLAPYILESHDRHPRGVVTKTRDGTEEVEFKIRLNRADEFLYWVRSFGSRAWIVSPESLRLKEKSEVKRTARRYAE
jgi:predicted DNA-binding transcriptional regulator YafY